MMRLLFQSIFFCIILVGGLPTAFAHLVDKAQESIVYIYFDVTDPTTGAKVTYQGTGFIVSPSGHVLTASHLFRDWVKQNQQDKKNNPIWASLRDKLGHVRESPLQLDDMDLGNPDGADVAFLKIDGHEVYSAAPVCLATPERGDAFFAFGFPGNQGFQFVRGMFGNVDGGRWTVDADFAPGMSGGPVYDVSGNVIGLVKGGLGDINAVRWVTPISYANDFLNMAKVKQCDKGWGASLQREQTQSTPSQNTPTILTSPFQTSLIEELLIRATDGHGHAIRNPYIEVISGSNVIYHGYGNIEGYVHFNFNHEDFLARR
jgi:S1-C subfamily serine protease